MAEQKKNKGGRPTKFTPVMYRQAEKLALLGATNEDIADFFEVAVSTISKWMKEDQKFSDAIKKGKQIADANVASSLYKRANGFRYQETKNEIVVTESGDELVAGKTRTMKQVAPDTTACIFWLKNRQPTLFRDKQTIEQMGETTHNISIERKVIKVDDPDEC